VNTYTRPNGINVGYMERYQPWIRDMYADLVAAINIATQLQAEVKRLEAMLENAGDTCHELQENNDALRAQVLRLRGELAEAEWAKYYAVQA
jgi:hypothetical protein